MRTLADGVLRCAGCQLEKTAGSFSFRNKRLGTLNWYCRSCQAAYRRAHYIANKPEYLRRAVTQVQKRRTENRHEIMRYLLVHPCVDCGITDPLLLEFDHRYPAQKLMEVSKIMVSRRWPRVLAEIEKCDVRCANCHRRRTAVQFKWRKARVR